MPLEVVSKLDGDSVVLDEESTSWILEVSYGFVKEIYHRCEGYWDSDLTWQDGPFNR